MKPISQLTSQLFFDMRALIVHLENYGAVAGGTGVFIEQH
jgi:hypothetical protein